MARIIVKENDNKLEEITYLLGKCGKYRRTYIVQLVLYLLLSIAGVLLIAYRDGSFVNLTTGIGIVLILGSMLLLSILSVNIYMLLLTYRCIKGVAAGDSIREHANVFMYVAPEYTIMSETGNDNTVDAIVGVYGENKVSVTIHYENAMFTKVFRFKDEMPDGFRVLQLCCGNGVFTAN